MKESVEKYEQGEWKTGKVYKAEGRRKNEGAGKTGGKNGSQNELDVSRKIIDFVSKDGSCVEKTTWLWPTGCLPKEIIPCKPKGTKQKRKCFEITLGKRKIYVITSFKYDIDLSAVHGIENLGVSKKNHETDIIIIESGRVPIFLEVGYQDVEGNAIDRQHGCLIYKFPLIKAATNDKAVCLEFVTGPAFDKNLSNNKIMKGFEWEVTRHLNNLPNLYLGEKEMPDLLMKIAAHFDLPI